MADVSHIFKLCRHISINGNGNKIYLDSKIDTSNHVAYLRNVIVDVLFSSNIVQTIEFSQISLIDVEFQYSPEKEVCLVSELIATDYFSAQFFFKIGCKWITLLGGHKNITKNISIYSLGNRSMKFDNFIQLPEYDTDISFSYTKLSIKSPYSNLVTEIDTYFFEFLNLSCNNPSTYNFNFFKISECTLLHRLIVTGYNNCNIILNTDKFNSVALFMFIITNAKLKVNSDIGIIDIFCISGVNTISSSLKFLSVNNLSVTRSDLTLDVAIDCQCYFNRVSINGNSTIRYTNGLPMCAAQLMKLTRFECNESIGSWIINHLFVVKSFVVFNELWVVKTFNISLDFTSKLSIKILGVHSGIKDIYGCFVGENPPNKDLDYFMDHPIRVIQSNLICKLILLSNNFNGLEISDGTTLIKNENNVLCLYIIDYPSRVHLNFCIGNQSLCPPKSAYLDKNNISIWYKDASKVTSTVNITVTDNTSLFFPINLIEYQDITYNISGLSNESTRIAINATNCSSGYNIMFHNCIIKFWNNYADEIRIMLAEQCNLFETVNIIADSVFVEFKVLSNLNFINENNYAYMMLKKNECVTVTLEKESWKFNNDEGYEPVRIRYKANYILSCDLNNSITLEIDENVSMIRQLSIMTYGYANIDVTIIISKSFIDYIGSPIVEVHHGIHPIIKTASNIIPINFVSPSDAKFIGLWDLFNLAPVEVIINKINMMDNLSIDMEELCTALIIYEIVVTRNKCEFSAELHDVDKYPFCCIKNIDVKGSDASFRNIIIDGVINTKNKSKLTFSSVDLSNARIECEGTFIAVVEGGYRKAYPPAGMLMKVEGGMKCNEALRIVEFKNGQVDKSWGRRLSIDSQEYRHIIKANNGSLFVAIDCGKYTQSYEIIGIAVSTGVLIMMLAAVCVIKMMGMQPAQVSAVQNELHEDLLQSNNILE